MKLNSLLFALFFAGQLTWAAENGKRSLDISVLPKDVQSELHLRFPQISAQKLTLENIDDIIRFLQLRPEFDLVQILDLGNGQLKINTERSTRISGVKFEGLQAVSTSEAKQLLAINENDVLNQDQLIAGGEKLRQHYNQIGYRNASIDVEIPPDGRGNVDLIVKVKEGVQTLIGSIAIHSLNGELNKILENRLARQRSYPLTDAQIAEIVAKSREYLNSKNYIRTEIKGPEISFTTDDSKAHLAFTLEKVDSYYIEYLGNREVSTSELNETLNLGKFYSVNPNLASELTTKIKNHYLSLGYARVEVQSDETEGRVPFTRKLTFSIDEGPKVRINRVEFLGSLSRPTDYYIKILKKLSSDLIQDGYYNKVELDQAFEALRVELQNQGHLLAKINSTRTQYNKEKDQVTVFVSLDEGPLTQIESIEFVGNHTISPDELLQAIELRSQEPLRLIELEKAIQNLKTYYQERGYIDMVLLNEKEDLVAYNDNNTQAKLNFRIYEGPQVHIASIVLDGNSFTKEYVILKEIDLQVGDTVTPSKVEEAVAKLQRTGFFSSVDIKTLEEKTSVANRTVVIKVTERDPGVFIFGAGATSDLGLTLRGYTVISYNNIFGTGRGTSIRLDGNYNVNEIKYLERKVTWGYLEPHLLGSKIRGRVNLTFSSQLTDYNTKRVSDVDQTTLSLERNFTSHVTLVYEFLNIAHLRDHFINPDPDTTQPEPLDIVTTGPRLDLDYRDNPFNPTRGTFTSFSYEYSDPRLGSQGPMEIKFQKTTGSFTHYLRVPLPKNNFMVWANSLRGGYLENLSTTGGVPYDKKGFYLGGSSTIRGFNGTTQFFPTYNELGIPRTETYYLRGIATNYLVKSEVRFPLWGNFGGAVFYDGGAVHIQNLNIQDEYRDSAGFGLRYNTPVGPLNVELAWKLDAKPGEDPYAFHLSFGSF